MKIQMTLMAVVLTILVGSSLAADWPQWQGPNRDGKSADAGLLQEWPIGGPPLAWKADNLGGGDSAPSIASGKIYGMGNRGDEEVVWALSEKDGSEIWATPLGPASDGTFLWRYDKPANGWGINCTTPIYHDGMVFASSAYGGGAGLAKLSKDASGSVKAEEVYATTEMQNHHGGMILLDGCLYGASGGNEGGALVCLDFKTGKVLWDQRGTAGRRAKGSLALADRRLYYRMESGTMLLLEPSPKQYIERGRFEQPDRRRQPAWAHPVIANGRLYVRDQDILFCYDVKAK
jgi:outer membrane protein assembly factor BamB